MFNLGWTELLVIFGAALLIFGPGKLPEVGATLGKAIREFKGAVNNIDADVKKEVMDIKDVASEVKETVVDLKSEVTNFQEDLKESVKVELTQEDTPTVQDAPAQTESTQEETVAEPVAEEPVVKTQADAVYIDLTKAE